jgi:hypothetical protein
MTVAPLSSTIVAIGLIPVAFLFCHAFLSGRKKNRCHPFSAVLAVSKDLSLSICYMLYRTFGGAVEGSILHPTPTLNVYFGIHGTVAIVVMALEISVLLIGLLMLKQI